MKRVTLWVSIGLMLTLILAACSSTTKNNGTPAASTATPLAPTQALTYLNPGTGLITPTIPAGGTSTIAPQESATGLPNTGLQAAGGAVTPPPPAPTALPKGIHSAQVIPANNHAKLNYLSNWMGMRVADKNGKVIGTASDYILNLCESHIIYIVMKANPDLGLKNGNTLLIPLEVVTVAGGTIDASQNVIFLPAQASDLSNAPTVNGQVNLSDLSWEETVRNFWSKYTQFTISTQCGTSAAAGQGKPIAVPKIGLASDILQATFMSEKDQTLGHIKEVILTPETGFVRFLAVDLDPSVGNGFVLIPTGVLTIKKPEASQKGSVLTLIVVDVNTLAKAPKVSSLPSPSDSLWEDQSYAYWKQYVKM